MSDNTRSLSHKTGAYLGRGDVKRFIQMFRDHPELLSNCAYWMRSAARAGQLEFIQAMVTELGIDVNTSKPDQDPSNPFYEPEGCILNAATAGHLDVVRWLLDHGAKINYTVGGQQRCLPLLFAVTGSDLEVVKLLVERGADLHATWNNLNAASHAEDYGKRDVLDYLRSVGAKTFREIVPPNYAVAHQQFVNQQVERLGPLSDWSLVIPGDPTITLHFVPVNEKSSHATLFTVGLSDHRLPQDWKLHACTELRCILPKEWPTPEVSMTDPAHNWPIKWLERIAITLRDADQLPEEWPLVMNGSSPQPLAPDTKLNGWVALKSAGEVVEASDYRYIDIHSLFPIYSEEAELIKKQGSEELVKRSQAKEIPLDINPQRPNLA